MIRLLLVLMMASSFLYAQDQDEEHSELEQLKVNYELITTELASVQADLRAVARPHAKNVMGGLLLERFVSPFDYWLTMPTCEIRNIIWDIKNPEYWYALVIEPENKFRYPPIWVKFLISNNDYHFVGWNIYIDEKRKGLLDALEHYIALNLSDPDVINTIINGTPHLYRLATRNTNIDTLRKEDRIY